DAVKLTILDFVTLGMGTLIVTPIDRFKGTSHLMAVDYEREGIHSSDDKVVGIYYKLKNNPNAMVWSDKGFLNTQKKDWEEVIRVSSIAITIDPDLTSPYIYRAGAYSMREEYDKAIKDFNTVLEIDPANALAYNNRGLALEEKGETDAAVKSYEKACELGMEKACENLVRFGDE
ncbi:tetratricopeptide repeat protein, partial [Thermodesulfobacteriota bacterium]